MAEHPYMPMFPEKFLADTLHIPWDATGAYAVLLMAAWARGGSLPNNEDQLRLMVRCSTKAWRKIWPKIAPFWMVGEDGRLHQKRMDKEWQRATEARAASVASGSAGGRKSAQEMTSSDSRGSFSSSKKPNDFLARARAGQPSHNPHPQRKEEEARDARGRALTRDASSGFKNGTGKAGRYGPGRKPSAADVAWQNLVDFERECAERRAAREQGTDSEASRLLDLELLPKVRH